MEQEAHHLASCSEFMPKKNPETCHQNLLTILATLPEDIRGAYVAFHVKHKALFLEMPASVKAHHAFVGGYAVHIEEVVTNLLKLCELFPSPTFTRTQAIIAAYLHDLDKLFWRYERDGEPPSEAQVKYAISLGIDVKGETKNTLSQRIDAAKNKKPLDPASISYHTTKKNMPFMDDSAAVVTLMLEHRLPGWDCLIGEAISLHHGGWAPVARADTKHRSFPPLAVLLHSADLISAQNQNGDETLPS